MSRSSIDRDSDRKLEENNLYVSNLSYNTQDKDLEEKFAKYGPIKHCKIIRDHNSGKSRGFGFVTFENVKDAEAAKAELDETDLDSRKIRIEKARRSGDRRSSPRRDRYSPRRDRSSPRRDRKSPRRYHKNDRYKDSPGSSRNRSPPRRHHRRSHS
jgi:RNA recognition motif-containing protein